MKLAGIIPARYGSSRFPGKPLAKITGQPMIIHTLESARQSGVFDDLIVATDDRRICDVVHEYGGQCVMTSEEAGSGTERCAEVLQNRSENWDAVINIQGDEPFIRKSQITAVAETLEKNAPIASLAKAIVAGKEILSSNTVKVVFNQQMQALYFSRYPIPFLRNPKQYREAEKSPHYKHIGIYGYQTQILKQLVELPQSKLEIAESLEQLRWLDHGYTIKISITEEESWGIDTPEDLDHLEKSMKHS